MLRRTPWKNPVDDVKRTAGPDATRPERSFASSAASQARSAASRARLLSCCTTIAASGDDELAARAAAAAALDASREASDADREASFEASAIVASISARAEGCPAP